MDKLKVQAYNGFIRLLIILAVLIFLPRWSASYWQGWLFLAAFSIPVLIITRYFLNHDRGLIERRLKAGPAAEKEISQKVIQSAASLAVVALIIVSAADKRYEWSTVSATASVIASMGILAGMYLVFIVFRQNSFTSAIITVAEEQPLISTGPYAVVRHPMYSGALLLFICTPVTLGSLYGLIPASLLTLVLMMRAVQEEKFLTINLAGYSDYCKKVHFRLLPYVW